MPKAKVTPVSKPEIDTDENETIKEQTAWQTYRRGERFYFQTSDGVELELMPIPPMVYNLFRSQIMKSEPPPPIVEIRKAGKPVTTPDYQDEDYQRSRNLWFVDVLTQLQAFVLSYIATEPPSDFVENEYIMANRKVQWIAGILPTEKELQALQDAITDITMPSEEGIADSENKFPDVSE